MWKTGLQERLFVGWAQRWKINLKLVCEALASSVTGRVFFQDSHSCGDFLLFPELCLRSVSHNSTHFTSIRPSGKEDW